MSTITVASQTPVAASSARHLTGQVVEVDEDTCLVSADATLFEARPSLSCLVALQVADRVALWVEADGKSHVLAVLERSAAGPLKIQTERDLQICSAGQLSLRSSVLSTVAASTQMLVGKLKLVAEDITAESRALKLVSHVAQVIANSLHLAAQRSFRNVEHSDHQRCGYLDIEAEQLVQIKASNAMITARQLTRIDGAQIHVG